MKYSVLPFTFRIIKIELIKYIRVLTITIICFAFIQSFLLSVLDAKDFLKFGNVDLVFFKVVNYHFTAIILTAIPLTLILTISNEFSSGYTLKLISNGLSRVSYAVSKYLLAGVLAIFSAILYILVIGLILLYRKANYVDTSLLLSSTFFVSFFSLLFSLFVASLSLIFRNWQYPLLIYYAYVIVESFVVYQFRESYPWVVYLPFNLSISIFQFEINIKTSSDYLVAGSLLLLFFFLITSVSFYIFKKADL